MSFNSFSTSKETAKKTPAAKTAPVVDPKAATPDAAKPAPKA